LGGLIGIDRVVTSDVCGRGNGAERVLETVGVMVIIMAVVNEADQYQVISNMTVFDGGPSLSY
jgi:hypothetical protein